MARSQSPTVWKVLGAVAAVVAGGAAFGYLFGSVRESRPAAQPVPPEASTPLAPPTATAPPSSIHPRTTNGNYTAPGAPRITIREESQPILRRTAPPAAPPPDSEATQEATPTPAQTTTPEAAPTDSTPPDNSGAPGAAPSSAAPGSPSGPNAPAPAAAPNPAAPPSPPADPDFEHVNRPASGAPDPEAGQQGGSFGKTPTGKNSSGPVQSGDAAGGKVQFRVQTGAYTDESSARSAADALRAQGFSASTRSERDGDHLVYKVQAGAYRSKVGANKAADDLQKKGYPAYISPIGP